METASSSSHVNIQCCKHTHTNSVFGRLMILIHSPDSPGCCRWVGCRMRSSRLRTCPWSGELRTSFIHKKTFNLTTTTAVFMAISIYQVRIVHKYEILTTTTFISSKSRHFSSCVPRRGTGCYPSRPQMGIRASRCSRPSVKRPLRTTPPPPPPEITSHSHTWRQK